MNSVLSDLLSVAATSRVHESETDWEASSGEVESVFANMAVNFTACSQKVFGAMTDGRVCAKQRSEYMRRE